MLVCQYMSFNTTLKMWIEPLWNVPQKPWKWTSYEYRTFSFSYCSTSFNSFKTPDYKVLWWFIEYMLWRCCTTFKNWLSKPLIFGPGTGGSKKCLTLEERKSKTLTEMKGLTTHLHHFPLMPSVVDQPRHFLVMLFA